MGRTVYTYDVENVVLQIDQIFINDGFPEGEKLTLEKRADDIEDMVGVNGSVYVSENNDGTYSLRVPQADRSPYIGFFMDLAAEKRGFPVAVVDMNENGRSFNADNCRIIKTPGMQALKAVGEMEIEILIPYLK